MKRLSMSMVSYLNSKPFLLGLEQSGLINEIDLSLEIPSKTAEKLLNNQVDVALVPVAILSKVENGIIITDYCIGANGKVDSVFLLSDVPLEQIETIYLDLDSRTSAKLIQLLSKKYWKINPKFIQNSSVSSDLIKEKSACLMIGDKAMFARENHQFCYDLAEEWQKWTDLPFVFAVFVAKNEQIANDWEQKLNDAFHLGMQNLNKLSVEYANQFPSWITAKHYFTTSIDFHFDEKKKEAMKLFLG